MRPYYSLFPLAAALFLGPVLTSNAALLVYEGFQYGASNVSMNGLTSSALGVTGNYTSLSGSPNGSATFVTNYQATGLTFSANFLTTAGGAMSIGTNSAGSSANNVSGAVGVALDVSSVTGTLYSSYLVNMTFPTTTTGSYATRLNTTATGGGANSNFGSNPYASGSPNGKAASSYDSGATTYSGANVLAANTTYLSINKFTNAGTAIGAGGGTSTAWFLTSANYDLWISTGLGLEANLDTYATIKISDTNAAAGTFNFDNTKFLQFATFSGNSGTSTTSQAARFDEVRWGTELGDVALVPETAPGVLGLGAAGFLAVLRRRRRQ
jgi:hypothetical protein